jgi:hypothetical protein
LPIRRLREVGVILTGDPMTDRAAVQDHLAAPATHDNDDPVTLHRIMQSMIGDGLKQRYAPPQRLSHELFVLMMQLSENERRGKARRAQTKQKQTKEAAAIAS